MRDNYFIIKAVMPMKSFDSRELPAAAQARQWLPGKLKGSEKIRI
jgi:hypothetical protein